MRNNAIGSPVCLDNNDYLFSIPNPVKAKSCSENVVYQVNCLTFPIYSFIKGINSIRQALLHLFIGFHRVLMWAFRITGFPSLGIHKINLFCNHEARFDWSWKATSLHEPVLIKLIEFYSMQKQKKKKLLSGISLYNWTASSWYSGEWERAIKVLFFIIWLPNISFIRIRIFKFSFHI